MNRTGRAVKISRRASLKTTPPLLLARKVIFEPK